MTQSVDSFLAELPTRRQESWKYTDLKGVSAVADGLGWSQPDHAADVPTQAIESVLPDLAADRCVIVNGHIANQVEGVQVSEDEIVISDQRDGALHLVFVSHADENAAVASGCRIAVAVKPGSHLSVIESHITQGGGNTLNVPQVSFDVGRDAQVRHAVLTDEDAYGFHIARTDIALAQGAGYEGFSLETGLGLMRRETTVSIHGEHAELFLGAAYLGRGSAHQDNTTLVVHEAPNAKSRQNFRGVLGDESRGVFQGKVLVAKGAQGTDGQQQHKALLLSPKAEVDAKPELEIYADDVECAHGATVGAIDPDQLFYLRARGISEEAARALLTEAFLMQSLSGISDGMVREAFRMHLAQRLGGLS